MNGSGLKPRDFHHALKQKVELVHLGAHLAHRVSIVSSRILKAFEIKLDIRQWCLGLVRNVGDKAFKAFFFSNHLIIHMHSAHRQLLQPIVEFSPEIIVACRQHLWHATVHERHQGLLQLVSEVINLPTLPISPPPTAHGQSGKNHTRQQQPAVYFHKYPIPYTFEM